MSVSADEGVGLDRIVKASKLTPAQAVAVGSAVLAELATLHGTGSSHGGLATKSVLIFTDGHVSLGPGPLAEAGKFSNSEFRLDVRAAGALICAAFGLDPVPHEHAALSRAEREAPAAVVTARAMAQGAMGSDINRARIAFRDTAGAMTSPEQLAASIRELAAIAAGIAARRSGPAAVTPSATPRAVIEPAPPMTAPTAPIEPAPMTAPTAPIEPPPKVVAIPPIEAAPPKTVPTAPIEPAPPMAAPAEPVEPPVRAPVTPVWATEPPVRGPEPPVRAPERPVRASGTPVWVAEPPLGPADMPPSRDTHLPESGPRPGGGAPRRPIVIAIVAVVLVVLAIPAGFFVFGNRSSRGQETTVRLPAASTSPARPAASSPSPSVRPPTPSPSLPPTSGSKVTAVEVKPNGQCATGTTCSMEVTVRFPNSNPAQNYAWTFKVIDKCTGKVTDAAGGSVTSQAGWIYVQADNQVALPATNNPLQVVVVTTGPEAVSSQPLTVGGGGC